MYAVERNKGGELSFVMDFNENGHRFMPVFDSMEGATTFCEDHKDIVGCEYKVIQVKVV
jgi:hypothetical protein